MSHQPIILFDGVCNFCNGIVNFLIKQDKKDLFRFSALQSETGAKILAKNNLSTERFDSVLYMENDRIYKSSTAALKIFARLAWYWKWTQVFWVVPPFLRNALYNLIAQNRYKLFGKKDQCMVPTAEVRKKFLD